MDFLIRTLAETASTNDDARRLAEDGAPAGTTVHARRQTAGRGRQGRVWSSPEGNLYASVVFRPPGGTQTYGFYSFIAALSVADTVAVLIPNAVLELKWPNDVLVDGAKICGILLEAGEGFLIAGMGLNVRITPDTPHYPATSLLAAGAQDPQPEVVLDRLLAALGYWTALYERDGFAPVRAAWLKLARKGPMRARLPKEEILGEFADLDEQGRLCLRLTDGNIRKINAGDIFF